MNAPTIAVLALLIAAAICALRSCLRSRGSCCGGCAGCPSSGHCHSTKQSKK